MSPDFFSEHTLVSLSLQLILPQPPTEDNRG